MAQEQGFPAESAESAPLGRCVIKTNTGPLVFECITEEDCDEEAVRAPGKVLSWTPNPDCE